jgi:mono/diheme cytochrome c family protein
MKDNAYLVLRNAIMERYIRIFTLGVIFAILTFAVGLTLFAPGCDKNQSADPPAISALSDPNLTVGKAIFEKNCMRCHPYGKAGMGPNLSKKKLTGETVKKQVRKGGLLMPAFSETRVSNNQLEQLAIFVPALNKSNK